MLALKQSLSLSSSNGVGGFNPINDSTLLAWWKNKVGVTESSGSITNWTDSSNNDYNLAQTTIVERPTYNSITGSLTFDKTNDQNLFLNEVGSTQISISGEFSIGIRFYPTDFGGTIIGDNNTSNEFLKLFSTSIIRLKIDGVSVNLSLNSGSNWGDDYILITRNSSGLIELYHNGVLQNDTETLTGTLDIDSMGIRAVDASPYGGIIFETQIYTSTSSDLSSNINNYLANI